MFVFHEREGQHDDHVLQLPASPFFLHSTSAIVAPAEAELAAIAPWSSRKL